MTADDRPDRPPPLRRIADGALLVLLTVAALLLGCQELLDTDIWWHVRSGQWILEHGSVPRTDPFSFASAGRPWIDLHWGFQLVVALAYRLGGVPGILLASAALGAAAFLVGLTSGPRDRPVWAGPLPWVAALLAMAWRLDPRPEVASLLLMAAYLGVLSRVDARPELAWALPPLQVIWVNTHGLFVLGPIILAACLTDRFARETGAPGVAADRVPPGRWWRHVGGAAAAVAAACLANPYGWRGATFPLELLPKITAWGGPYKAYIAEFMGMPEYVRSQTPAVAARNLYFRAEYFLLLALPPSFVLPATWSIWQSASAGGPRRAWAWLTALGLAAAVAAAGPLAMPGGPAPAWLARASLGAPLGFLLLGACGAVLLEGRSSRAALLAGIGAIASAAWAVWLARSLFGVEPGWLGALGEARGQILGGAAAASGLTAAALAWRAGARPSRLLLAAAFAGLALQAVRNANLFALAAGFVLSGNLGDWAARLEAGRPAAGRGTGGALGTAARAALAAAAGLWIVAIASGRFHASSGERHAFGLREQPLAYAHGAARFAGRPGMPERALACDLRQAGVYVFHNAPARKVFMDARLEVPTRETFEAYVRLERQLNEGRGPWAEGLRRLGDPLVLLDHAEDVGAEATLLADPRWRCVYYDEAGSVFLPEGRPPLEAEVPTLELHALHMAGPPRAAGVEDAYARAAALANLGAALRRRPGPPWRLRIPVLLLAADYARIALEAPPLAARSWMALGHCAWNMTPDLGVRPTGPDEPWDLATGWNLSRATYCYRSAAGLAPDNPLAWLSLHDAFARRRMGDAQRSAAQRLGGLVPRGGPRGLGRDGRPTPERPPRGSEPDAEVAEIDRLLERYRPEEAVRYYEALRLRDVAIPWEVADRVAAARLHLGDPAGARRVWESSPGAPSRAVRLARMADADLVGMEPGAARDGYRRALALDPGRGDGWLGLALLALEAGRADEALEAARQGLRRELTGPQRRTLGGIATLAGAAVEAGGRAPAGGR